MTLFDDNTARNLEPMTTANETHTSGPAIVERPEPETISAEPQASAPETPASENPAPSSSDDFAAALENFTTETEEAVGEDHVIKGTVVKLTATHVVVDIGAKSEGMLPIAEVLDHEGKAKFQPGNEIDVMREKGETEEGYVNLSHEKAQRLRAWDEIERAYNEKKPIQAIVIDRIKGGLTVDILGARAFLPGSQVDLRPIRNLDGMKGQPLEVAVIKLNKKRGNIVVSRKQLLEEEQTEKRSLLVIVHGFGAEGWRVPEARQTYLLRHAVGTGMATSTKEEAALAQPSSAQMPRLQGDVIQESRDGRKGFLFWTGGHYAWYSR